MRKATKTKGKKRASCKGKGSTARTAKVVKAFKPKEKAPEGKEKALSGLDAAAKVLKEVGQPLNCKALVAVMLEKGYWKSGGKTPWATLYSAILREINEKKNESRFEKTGRGLFEFSA